MSTFRIATRDELWSNGRLIEFRLSHGEAVQEAAGIIATDARDDTLIEICERELARLRDAMPGDARVRLVAEASTDGVSATMTIRRNGLSIVTTPEHAQEDDALLVAVVQASGLPRVEGGTPTPHHHGRRSLIWKNGTGAVLLHEAVGHAAEHGHEPIDWPAWLTVDLSLRLRRETFRDVPLMRMSHVVVTQTNAPFEPPDEAIEIVLVSGGRYEPLTQTVTMDVVPANAAPFEYRATRREIAASLSGAFGPPIRYPGVICSREGQELVVPCSAPVMVTR